MRALTVSLVILVAMLVAAAITLKAQGYSLTKRAAQVEAQTDRAVSAELTIKGADQLNRAAAGLANASANMRAAASAMDQQAAHDPTAQSALPAGVADRLRRADDGLCRQRTETGAGPVCSAP